MIVLLVGIITPIIAPKRILRAYSIIIVILFFHWMTNDDTCILTHLESKITGKPKDETFIGRVIKPIYKIDETDSKLVLKTVFFLLWMLTQYRLGRLNPSEFLKN